MSPDPPRVGAERAVHTNSQRAPFETPPEKGGSSGRAVRFLFLHSSFPAHAEGGPVFSGAVSKRARLEATLCAKPLPGALHEKSILPE